MIFYIKQNSELPILELKPYKGKDYSELSELIKNATVTFSMYDDKDCFRIRDKSGIINLDTKENSLNNQTDNCKELLDFTIQYHFTKKDTAKIGKYKGVFKIKFEQDGEEKTLITPYSKILQIEVIKSNTKTIKSLSEEIVYGLITDISDEYVATNNDEVIKYK